ncbi:Ribokinase-like protein [Obba rivulosa]|uniref:Ribokinase-like protein n=1 Tax=Obba rivulosa TaxID=1052685 RepID=A0A8E2DRC1_9APHY|nr:Ribokinase-like protein [Obba rivulosa]
MAPQLVTLGMFIIDEFEYQDEHGNPTGQTLPSQIGGGGTYASVGARIWLPAEKIGMIVDRGDDFPPAIQDTLNSFGKEMWLYRDNPDRKTTRSLNSYRGDHRGFQYLTPRIRITPRDLIGTKLEHPATLHFICSPSRASAIMSEVHADPEWKPITVYEPIPDRCVPAELPALIKVLPYISILSPNAEEALSLLSIPQPSTKALIEEAGNKLLELGVGDAGCGHVIVRSGHLGAFVATRERSEWVDAYWTEHDAGKVVDVTGAGNSFLGGLAAGLLVTSGDVFKATLYATVSASFVVEQAGLPVLTRVTDNDGTVHELWNGDSPERRLKELQKRLGKVTE